MLLFYDHQNSSEKSNVSGMSGFWKKSAVKKHYLTEVNMFYYFNLKQKERQFKTERYDN